MKQAEIERRRRRETPLIVAGVVLLIAGFALPAPIDELTGFTWWAAVAIVSALVAFTAFVAVPGLIRELEGPEDQ